MAGESFLPSANISGYSNQKFDILVVHEKGFDMVLGSHKVENLHTIFKEPHLLIETTFFNSLSRS